MGYFLNHMLSSRIVAALMDLLFLVIFAFAVIGIIATVSWVKKRKRGRRR